LLDNTWDEYLVKEKAREAEEAAKKDDDAAAGEPEPEPEPEDTRPIVDVPPVSGPSGVTTA
jgi:hypothetical protein